MCYVDNYCHGLIIGERALYPGSPALRNFYICTDGEPVNLWRFIDRAPMDMLPGAKSLFSKFKLPGWSFMYPLGRMCEGVGYLAGKEAQAQHVQRAHAAHQPVLRSVRRASGTWGTSPSWTPDEAWTITRDVVQGGVGAQARAREEEVIAIRECTGEREGGDVMDAGRGGRIGSRLARGQSSATVLCLHCPVKFTGEMWD